MLPFWKWLNGTYGNYGNRDTSKCITCKVLAAVTTAAGAAVATAVQQQLINAQSELCNWPQWNGAGCSLGASRGFWSSGDDGHDDRRKRKRQINARALTCGHQRVSVRVFVLPLHVRVCVFAALVCMQRGNMATTMAGTTAKATAAAAATGIYLAAQTCHAPRNTLRSGCCMFVGARLRLYFFNTHAFISCRACPFYKCWNLKCKYKTYQSSDNILLLIGLLLESNRAHIYCTLIKYIIHFNQLLF